MRTLPLRGGTGAATPGRQAVRAVRALPAGRRARLVRNAMTGTPNAFEVAESAAVDVETTR